MNKQFSKIIGALAAVAAFVLVGAAKCEGPMPSGLILSIDRPPLAQTLGCPDGLWRLGILSNDIANDPKLTTDQKAAKAQKVCLKEKEASKYVVEGQFP